MCLRRHGFSRRFGNFLPGHRSQRGHDVLLPHPPADRGRRGSNSRLFAVFQMDAGDDAFEPADPAVPIHFPRLYSTITGNFRVFAARWSIPDMANSKEAAMQPGIYLSDATEGVIRVQVSIITSNTATNYRIKCRHFGELYNALTLCSPNEKSVVIKLSPLSSLQPQKTVADGRRCLPEGRPLRRRPKAVLSTPSFQRWVWRARRPCHCAGGSSCR